MNESINWQKEIFKNKVGQTLILIDRLGSEQPVRLVAVNEKSFTVAFPPSTFLAIEWVDEEWDYKFM